MTRGKWIRWWSPGVGLLALAAAWSQAAPIPVEGQQPDRQRRQEQLRDPDSADGQTRRFNPSFGRGRRDASPDLQTLDLTAEQRELLMNFVRRHMPQRHRVLERLRQRDPDAFEGRVRMMAPRVMEILRRMEENPELGELLLAQQQIEEDLHKLLRDYRRVSDGGPDTNLLPQIEAKVSQLVQVRLDRRGCEIEALARRLEDQRCRLEADWARFEEMVAGEMKRLLEERPRGPSGSNAQSGDRETTR